MFSRFLSAILLSCLLLFLSADNALWAVGRGLITIDFDITDGDQERRETGGAISGKIYDVQLNYRAVLQIIGWSITIEYDPDAVRYVSGSFQPTDYIPGLLPLVDEQADYVAVGGTVLGSGTSPTEPGVVGTLSFEIQGGFSDSTQLSIVINEFRFEEGGSEKYDVLSIATITDDEELRGDFDNSGKVDFTDFFAFADAFGTDYHVYDLDGSGTVDFDDFFIFADNFGRTAASSEDVTPTEPDDGQGETPSVPDSSDQDTIIVVLPNGQETTMIDVADWLWLDKDAVTLQQWKAAGLAGGDASAVEGDDGPVIHVTEELAQRFCRWAGKRLPTEEEWAVAARVTKLFEPRYPWIIPNPGDDNILTVRSAVGFRCIREQQ